MPADPLPELESLLLRALTRAALPHRSPTHRMCEQLAAAAEAAAFAQVIALLTGTPEANGTALRLAQLLRNRIHIDQSEINSAEHAESKLRRFGLR